jgi:hypothetical protein
VEALDASLDGVKALFGTGAAAERAEQLVGAGTARLRAIENAQPGPFSQHFGTRGTSPQALDAAKNRFEAAASEYVAAAASALHDVAPGL